MVYVGLALAVWKATQLVRHFIEIEHPIIEFATIWAFTVGLSALGLWIVGLNPAWCLAVGAGAGLLHRFDSLLMAGTDAARVTVLRSRRR